MSKGRRKNHSELCPVNEEWELIFLFLDDFAFELDIARMKTPSG